MNENEMMKMKAAAEELGYSNLEELCDALWQKKEKGAVGLLPEDLSDLCEIEIDENLPTAEQVVLLLKQTPNPFYYRYEGMIIKISEAGEQTINRILEEVLLKGRRYA